MNRVLAETELPSELSAFQAVDAAYPAELTRCYDALRRRLPVLIEAEKELAPYLYRSLRDRLKADGTRCLYLDGRTSSDLPPPPPGASLVGAMIHQLREAVRGAVGERIVVLPHLDILGASGGTGFLGAEAREVIPLLYENPEVLWLGFKDPAFPLPKVIDEPVPASRGDRRDPARAARVSDHPARGAQVRARLRPVPALQVRLRRQRGAAAPAARHARGRGLSRRSSGGDRTASLGDADERRPAAERVARQRHRRLWPR